MFLRRAICAEIAHTLKHIVAVSVQNLEIIDIYACCGIVLAEEKAVGAAAARGKRQGDFRPVGIALYAGHQLNQTCVISVLYKVKTFRKGSAALNFKIKTVVSRSNRFCKLNAHIALIARIYKVQRAYIIGAVPCDFDIAGRCIRAAAGVGSVPPVGRITVGNSRGP